MDTCKQCGGLLIPPGISYNYSGPVCLCSRRILVTPMPQAEIDEALVLAMEADKREIERLRAELAASQAREKVLRDAIVGLLWLDDEHQRGYDDNDVCAEVHHAREALALPADDTTLREMLTRAQKEMQERCARTCGALMTPSKITRTSRDWITGTLDCATAIRALEVKP